MKNRLTKTCALCLCAALAAGTTGGAVLAFTGNKEKTEVVSEVEKSVLASPAATAEVSVATKDETVYVLAGADGAVRKIIVSDWLKNTLGEDKLNDATTLTDVVNVKGNEGSTAGDNGSRVWDADGHDICYQGNIDSELPVDMKVSYKLDGVSITPAELKGKSGRVTIRFDYENKLYETVKIGENEEKIYVPFAVVTGLILDNDTFTNIEVSNGKLINDGTRTIVAGIAFPGLQESLNINSEKLIVPLYVEVTADAKDFSLGMTLSLATNSLFNEIDTSFFDDFTNLADMMTQLSGAVKQLADGSTKIHDGLSTLLDKSTELVEGVNAISDGAKKLKNGASDLDGGIGQLQGGADTLAEGLNTLTANSDALNAGAKQVFETMLATAQSQFAAAGLAVPSLTIENYASILDEVLVTLTSHVADGQAAQTLAAVKAQLDSYNEFYTGLKNYTAGVAQAAGGADQLKVGVAELKGGSAALATGAEELSTGIDTMKGGLPALIIGVTQLRNGAESLANGLNEFNEKGVEKLTGFVDGDMTGLLERVKATINASKNYSNFSGISDQMDGQVKFIYRTAEIGD